jgi:hypothetical protein
MTFNEINTVEKMSDYHSPDDIWQALYKIESKEEHVEKFVIKGRFQETVPQDILKSYLTVEYLMAHSYYHWPMYDEALKKLLGTLEMAVKFRCKELDIPLEIIQRNGRKRNKRLVDLIKELHGVGYPATLKSVMNHYRNLRNHFAHPDRNSFGGAIMQSHILPLINTINQIFLPLSYFEYKKLRALEAKLQVRGLKDLLFKLPFNGQFILGYNPSFYGVVWIGDRWAYCITFIPIIHTANFKEYAENHSINPVNYFFSHLSFSKNGFSAQDLFTTAAVEIASTDKEKNIHKYVAQLDGINALDQMTHYHFFAMYYNKIYTDWKQFVYMNCWPEMKIIEDN